MGVPSFLYMGGSFQGGAFGTSPRVPYWKDGTPLEIPHCKDGTPLEVPYWKDGTP